MPEIKLTPYQVEDSRATLEAAVEAVFSQSDRDSGYYSPDELNVPRPSFELFKARVEQARTSDESLGGQNRYLLDSGWREVLASFPGLRGLAMLAVNTSVGPKQIIRPAIVLDDRKSLALLVAEAPENNSIQRISEMQHILLTAEYIKYRADVKEKHTDQDVQNAGDIAPALVVVSQPVSPASHQAVHVLANGTDTAVGLKTFAPNFSSSGRQDIVVGHDVRRVRSSVVNLARVVMSVGYEDQLPPDTTLLDLHLSDKDITVATTLAATISRMGKAPDLRSNFRQMVGE